MAYPASYANIYIIQYTSSVTYIGDYALSSDPNLMSVYFLGDTPTLGLFPFAVNFDTIVYYLPGTTGWSSTFGGLPAQPLGIQIDEDFGLQTNQFCFRVTGIPNYPIVVEARSDLLDGAWIPLETTNLVNGSYVFADPDWTNYPTRMYRVRSIEERINP